MNEGARKDRPTGLEENLRAPEASSPLRTPHSALDWLPHLLQTTDSIFPTGSYAHSFGLEELANLGLVHNAETLADFLQRQIIPALEHLELPYLRFAHDTASKGDLLKLRELDAELSAIKVTMELRQASINIGRQRLGMLLEIAPNQMFSKFQTDITAGRAKGHHLIIFGLQTAVQKLPLDAALGAFYYGALSSVTSASMKVIRIGQVACHKVLADALQRATDVIARSKRVKREDAGWFNPLLDIVSARHETAYTRLFIS